MLNNDFFDQHVHTTYSPDGKSSLSDYLVMLETTPQRHFMMTDHVDYDAYFLGHDCIVDYEAVKAEINDLLKVYKTQVLMGVEMGYRSDYIDQINAYLSSQKFDSIIMSMHENIAGDYYKKDFRAQYTFDGLLKLYFDDILSLVTNMDNFDILGHIDYVFRVIDLNIFNITKYEDIISQILKKLIEKGKTLEINTGTIRYIKTEEYAKYILKLYRSLGGEQVSLGSDAHITKHYMFGFEDAVELLKSLGFEYVVCYKKRKLNKITI